LGKADVDGLITCKMTGTDIGTDVQGGRLLGIGPRYGASLDYGSCNFSLHLGVMAIVWVWPRWSCWPTAPTSGAAGWIAVAEREWARLNPLAVFQQPMSMEQYWPSRT
jgi:hypothetical protein